MLQNLQKFAKLFSRLNTDLEIAPRSGAASCPYSWAALNVAGKPPPVDSSWHAVARFLEPPSGAIYRKGVPKKCEPSSTRDAANHSICCLRVELMQPAPKLAVGKLLRTTLVNRWPCSQSLMFMLLPCSNLLLSASCTDFFPFICSLYSNGRFYEAVRPPKMILFRPT